MRNQSAIGKEGVMEFEKELRSFRYLIIRFLSCPLPGIFQCIPIIGQKTIPEIIIIAAVLAIPIWVAISTNPLNAGTVANIVGFLVIVFAIRNNFVLNILGMSFESYISWHKILTATLIGTMLFHGIEMGCYGPSGIALAILLGVTSLLYFTIAFIGFTLFYFLHILLFLAIVPVAIIHGATLFGAAIAVWGADIILRYLIAQRKVKAKVSFAGASVLRIEFDKVFSYTPGQYFFLMSKDVNVFEYHPFSSTTSPKSQTTVFYTKKIGDWTLKLHEVAKNKLNNNVDQEKQIAEMEFYVEGPYGNITIDCFNASQYKVSCLQMITNYITTLQQH
jgi:predicted ferric reductase